MNRHVHFKMEERDFALVCKLIDALKPGENVSLPLTVYGWQESPYRDLLGMPPVIRKVAQPDEPSSAGPKPPTRDEMIELGEGVSPLPLEPTFEPKPPKPDPPNGYLNIAPYYYTLFWGETFGSMCIENPYGAQCVFNNYDHAFKVQIGRHPAEIKQNIWLGYVRYQKDAMRDAMRVKIGAAKSKAAEDKAFSKSSRAWNGTQDEWRQDP